MTTAMTPYLRFAGIAREAMEYYHSVFGGELSVMTFAEGMHDGNPATADLVMHSSLYVGRGLHLMASDTPPEVNATGNGAISLSNDGADAGDAESMNLWWSRLAEASRLDLPLETAPWGDAFGQLTDRYGVVWMFNIAAQPA